MEKKKSIKSLEIFSKKCNATMNFVVSGKKLVLEDAVNSNLTMSWLDKGWNNSSSGWMDKGWNNSSSGWMDKGWNNSSSGWTDSGWNNSSSGWTDSGWTNSDGSGCYITTACVEHMGLTDDCKELTILRQFRDKLVEEDSEFRKQVLEYYRTAPKIVKKIMESDDKDLILNSLYYELVEPCVRLLNDSQSEKAKNHYISVYKKLVKKYIDQ